MDGKSFQINLGIWWYLNKILKIKLDKPILKFILKGTYYHREGLAIPDVKIYYEVIIWH